MHIQDLEYNKFDSKGAVRVALQDQTTPILIAPFQLVTDTTSLLAASIINNNEISVTDTTGFIDGKIVIVSDVESGRYFIAQQVGDPVGQVILLDSPLDFAFPTVGTVVTAGTDNLAVDGSATPVVFSIRASNPSVPIVIDITRILFHALTATAVDLSLFGDIAALTNGLVLRRVDGTYSHIFNVKSNQDLAGLMYDFQIYTKSNPVQGVDGLVGRMTFAGQSKMGVVIRLGPGEDLQLIVQDNLSAITLYHVTAEGHVVDPT